MAKYYKNAWHSLVSIPPKNKIIFFILEIGSQIYIKLLTLPFHQRSDSVTLRRKTNLRQPRDLTVVSNKNNN